MDIKTIPLSLVKPSPMNPRKTFDQEGIEELAANIEKQGLLQPITVRPTANHEYAVCDGVGDFQTTYEIVCGERRYRAVCLLSEKWTEMDCVAPNGESFNRFSEISAIVREMSDAEAFDAMITENLQRKDVDPIEEAFAFGQLIDRGNTAEEVALRFGKSIRFVQDRVKLNSLIPELMLAIRDGKMPISAGMLIGKLDEERQRRFYKLYADSEAWSKNTAERFVDNQFMNIPTSPWMKGGEPGFEGSCGKRCEKCNLNTANHGCLFYEMRASDCGRCTNREKFNAKVEDYALHVVDTYADQLVKVDEGLTKGKMVVGINIESWYRDDVVKPMEAMEKRIREKGFEVVISSKFFDHRCAYDLEDERTVEMLANGECYTVLDLYSYTEISPVVRAYYVKKEDKETNKNELGIPNEVQKLMSEYQQTQNINSTLTIEGAKAIGCATPTIKALSNLEKVALAVMLMRDCGPGSAREKVGLKMIDKTSEVQKYIEERIDTIFPCILKYWMQQKIGSLSNAVLYEVEKYLPDLGKLWCEEEYKASQDAVIAKRDKKLKGIDKKLSNLGYSPSGKKLIKPKTYTPEEMKKQYEEMKQKHPDATLLFRIGDFYEIFGEDAVNASKVLGLTITKRADGTQLCGFPHHALDTYLKKLVRAGLRAAICEQLEDPRK